jgi:hypothetical protein
MRATSMHRLRHVAAQLLALEGHLLIGRQQFGTRHQNRIEIARRGHLDHRRCNHAL